MRRALAALLILLPVEAGAQTAIAAWGPYHYAQHLNALSYNASAAFDAGEQLDVYVPVQASASFTGSISGSTLTVTAASGYIGMGNTLSGAGVGTGVTVLQQLTTTTTGTMPGGVPGFSQTGPLPGGTGTYKISTSLAVAGEAMTTLGPAVPSTVPYLQTVHGGKCSSGSSQDFQHVEIGEMGASWGNMVGSLNYYLANASNLRTNPFQDCTKLAVTQSKTTIQYMRNNTTQFGVTLDPARVALIGSSAGAHIAVLSTFTDANHGGLSIDNRALNIAGGFEPVSTQSAYSGTSDSVSGVFSMYCPFASQSQGAVQPYLGSGETFYATVANASSTVTIGTVIYSGTVAAGQAIRQFSGGVNCIPANTTISAVSGSTITMSASATCTPPSPTMVGAGATWQDQVDTTPITWVRHGLPPIVEFHGGADNVVPPISAIIEQAALVQAGVRPGAGVYQWYSGAPNQPYEIQPGPQDGLIYMNGLGHGLPIYETSATGTEPDGATAVTGGLFDLSLWLFGPGGFFQNCVFGAGC